MPSSFIKDHFISAYMEEKLLRLSFVIAIVGILSLFWFLQTINPDSVEMSLMESSVDSGNHVKLIGVVDKSSSYDGVTFLTILRTETIEIIAFDNVSIENGARVEIIGAISEEDGRNEVIASWIRVF